MFLGETRRGEAGPGTIDGTLASTVLHGSGCILLSFSAFSFLWLAAFVGNMMGTGGVADMMDGIGVHG